MRRPHHELALLSSFIILSGCSQDPGLQASQARVQAQLTAAQAQIAAGRAHLQQAVQEERQAEHAGTLPKDYKAQIDARFASTLIDPGSRQIEYISTPFGGLVCGYVNAKNRLGGYTGRHPFYAIFSQVGVLTKLNEYTPEELAQSGHVDLGATTDCGFQ